jgi:D-proline reductase (dithiol) PrdB
LIEEAGISTIQVSLMPYILERLLVPRAVAVENPFGFTLGKPGDKEGQMQIIRETLKAAITIETPGTVVELPYRWVREKTDDPEWYDGKYFKPPE